MRFAFRRHSGHSLFPVGKTLIIALFLSNHWTVGMLNVHISPAQNVKNAAARAERAMTP
jgi:hypothetical protein